MVVAHSGAVAHNSQDSTTSSQGTQMDSLVARRRLGKTDLGVSPVALGCWPIAWMTSLDVNG